MKRLACPLARARPLARSFCSPALLGRLTISGETTREGGGSDGISSSRGQKKNNYPKLEISDNVRAPVINKVKKGYKDSFSKETHKVDDVTRGLYTVDGSLHTRKDLQVVKGNLIKAPTKTKAQQKRDIQGKVGKL